jgi:glycine/D-amino acid oxidase-like deaminating enzyme
LTINSREHLFDILKDQDIIEGYGNLLFSLSLNQSIDLEKKLELIKSFSSNVSIISKEELTQLLKSKKTFNGLWDPDSFHVDTEKLVFFFRDQLIKFGVTILENSMVLRFSHIGINLLNGEFISGKNIVICTGVDSDEITSSKFLGRIQPIKTLMGVTNKLPTCVLGTYSAYDAREVMSYFRMTNTKFYFGGCDSQFKMTNKKIKEKLKREFEFIFENETIEFDEVWQAEIDLTISRLPHLNYDGNIYVGYGLNGHGLNLAFCIGKSIAEHIDGHRNDFEIMSRFFKSKQFIKIPFINNLISNSIVSFLSHFDRI